MRILIAQNINVDIHFPAVQNNAEEEKKEDENKRRPAVHSL